MTAKEIIKILLAAGFVEAPASKHCKMVHPDGRVTMVGRHKGDLPLGTVKAIEKQTGVKLL